MIEFLRTIGFLAFPFINKFRNRYPNHNDPYCIWCGHDKLSDLKPFAQNDPLNDGYMCAEIDKCNERRWSVWR